MACSCLWIDQPHCAFKHIDVLHQQLERLVGAAPAGCQKRVQRLVSVRRQSVDEFYHFVVRKRPILLIRNVSDATFQHYTVDELGTASYHACKH